MSKQLTRTIKVDTLARVEGEGALYVKLKGNQVQDVKLKIYEPPRFFEAFLRGRHFSELPDIVARICGICPIAYQMSAVHATERALGIGIDPEYGCFEGCFTAENGLRAIRFTCTCCTRRISSAIPMLSRWPATINRSCSRACA